LASREPVSFLRSTLLRKVSKGRIPVKNTTSWNSVVLLAGGLTVSFYFVFYLVGTVHKFIFVPFVN